MPTSLNAQIDSSADFQSRASALYGQMRDALRRGDWAAFGRAFEAMGRLVGERNRERP